MSPSFSYRKFHLIALLTALMLSGCAGEMAFREGKRLISDGKMEEGVASLQQAVQAAPENLEFRTTYLNSREKAAERFQSLAQREAAAGHLDAAGDLFNRALKVDPSNRRSNEGLAALQRSRRHLGIVAEADALIQKRDYEGAEGKLALVLLEDPRQSEARALKKKIEDLAGRNQVIPPALRKTFQKPISLEFRDATLKQLVEALSRYSGLNFILDKDLPANLTATLFLREVSVEDALDVLMTTLNLDKRILNDNTLLIYPSTAAKQAEHQDLVVKSFYLSNANAKLVMEMLKTVIKAKNLYVVEKLNLVIMRDNPAAIRLAERLVAIADVAEPEVMLEVEVMEVQRSRLQDLGIQFPDQLTLSPLASGTTLTLDDLKHLNASRVGATISNAIINLHKDIGEANILANPRIRAQNGEKAEIKIGDRVPVITTTSTATGFVSENVQYVDVGLKLNVEPRVYPDDEVALKIGLEVSSVVKEVVSKAGTLSYQIGSRNASTVLRLKDGETQILGGLINDQDQTSANRIPGLGDFPVLGRLFSSQKDGSQKTELVLSITPHIIRGLVPPSHVPTEFWSGTENNLRLRPLAMAESLSIRKPLEAPPLASSGAATIPTPQKGEKERSFGASDAPLMNAPILSWEGKSQVNLGGNLRLALKVSSAHGIRGFPIQIKYDPAILEMTDAAAGEFMGQRNVATEFARRIVNETGMAFFTLNRGGDDEATGVGTLLDVQFRALKPTANTLITVLPTVALIPGNKATAQTGPTVLGVSVTP